MKRSLFIFCLLTTFVSHSQKIQKFFNYSWKECEPSLARFYAIIQFNDGIWYRQDFFIRENKLQMRGSYKDSACKIPEGLFYYFHSNGKLESTGKYNNGKREGLWLRYHDNGMLYDSVVYHDDKVTGTRQRWYSDGFPMDSSVCDANGKMMYIGWYNNGNPFAAGYTIHDSLIGIWQYFHKNGNKSAVEQYDHGKLLNRTYYDTAGNPMIDTANRDKPATFPGGSKAWTKYILSKLYFPSRYEITGGDQATVVVDADIDEEGRMINIEVTAPFYPDFDEIAVKTLKQSPKWNPAIDHNRAISYHIRQPVTFSQQD